MRVDFNEPYSQRSTCLQKNRTRCQNRTTPISTTKIQHKMPKKQFLLKTMLITIQYPKNDAFNIKYLCARFPKNINQLYS